MQTDRVVSLHYFTTLSTSTDEEVARDFILFGQPDVTLVVADATRLG